MCRILSFAVACSLFQNPALAQRDPPVWDSYLDRIAVYHLDRLSTNLEFVWQKGGGTRNHKEHQVYLLAYLEKNEQKIQKLLKDPRLMTKGEYENEDGTKGQKKILEVLLERKLVTVVGTRVAKFIDHDLNDNDPKTARRTFAFPFAFKFHNQELFDFVRQLPGFDFRNPERVEGVKYYKDWFKDDFKIMPFIPVNDCHYANNVKPENKANYDFAYGEGYGGDTGKIAQYIRPLPYVFNIARLSSGDILIYIH